MNCSLLRTLPLFLVSLVLTMMMTPSMTHNETSAKPPFDPITLVPLIQDIRESKRSILLMASLPTRLLVIISAPASSTLTEALVFEQSPKTLRHNDMSHLNHQVFLSMHLQTEPQLFTQKWPKLAHLTAGATCVALRDAYQRPEAYNFLSANEYLLIGDTGRLSFLQLDTGDLTQRALNHSSLYDRLFKCEAILLSTFNPYEPMTFTRLFPRGRTHILSAEKVTFSSAEGRLPSFESFSIHRQRENVICRSRLTSHADICRRPANWSITYGFEESRSVYLSEALTSSLIQTALFYGAPFKPTDPYYRGANGAPSVPLAAFWALPPAIETTSVLHRDRYRIYLLLAFLLAIALLCLLLGVALVALKYWLGKESSSSDKKKLQPSSSRRFKATSGSLSKSKTGSSRQSKKGSSSSPSTQA